MKKVLILGACLGAGLFAVSFTAALGVVLGTRTLVVSADALRQGPASSLSANAQTASPEVRVAMRSPIAAGE